MRFIDTNILLYAFGADEGSGRPETARHILAGGDLAFSIQVFQEFYVQSTHSRRKEPLTHDEACAVIETLASFPLQTNDLAVFRAALIIRDQWRVSFWDASILAAARMLGCECVVSEDLSHEQDYGGVIVSNPFLTT
ncbi:MAG: PIN domain-containing protein [Verrucomicrobiia bacterium]|jgi:predicted nucleic acid-binding protein